MRATGLARGTALLLLLLCGAGLLALAGGLVVLAGWGLSVAPSLFAPRVYERSEFERTFQGMTVEELRRKLGNPDGVAEPTIPNWDALPTSDDLWTYHKRTRKPDASEPDAEVYLRISHGRVTHVIFNDPIRLR